MSRQVVHTRLGIQRAGGSSKWEGTATEVDSAHRCRRRRTAEHAGRNMAEVAASAVIGAGRGRPRPPHCPCCPTAHALAGPDGATAKSSPGAGPPGTVVQLDPSQCAASGVVDRPTPTTHASSGRGARTSTRVQPPVHPTEGISDQDEPSQWIVKGSVWIAELAIPAAHASVLEITLTA